MSSQTKQLLNFPIAILWLTLLKGHRLKDLLNHDSGVQAKGKNQGFPELRPFEHLVNSLGSDVEVEFEGVEWVTNEGLEGIDQNPLCGCCYPWQAWKHNIL